MKNAKKILIAIGGALLFALGVILRSLSNRSRVQGPVVDINGVRENQRRAESGLDNTRQRLEDSADKLEDSTDRVDGIASGVDRSAALIARGREILQAAKARSDNGGGSE